MLPPYTHTLHIEQASTAWQLIMQSGVRLRCTTGIPLSQMLEKEFDLSGKDLAQVDCFILDGMPVDEPEHTIVPNFARLALASALPGIAGLAMKKGSAVRGLRSGITHKGGSEIAITTEGEITLSLYSLVIPALAGHFLAKGVLAEAGQIIRYCQFSPQGTANLDGQAMPTEKLPAALTNCKPSDLILLSAKVTS